MRSQSESVHILSSANIAVVVLSKSCMRVMKSASTSRFRFPIFQGGFGRYDFVRVGERKLEGEVPGLPARGGGGLELGDLAHGNGGRVVLPSARVLEVVVDGGRPVLPGAPVGRDRALDGGRERGDLGEDFGAGTALFR